MTTRLSLSARVAAAIALIALIAGCANSSPSSAGSSGTGVDSANAASSSGDSATPETAASTDDSSATAGSSPASGDSAAGNSPAMGNSPTMGGGAPSQADSTPAQEGTGAESPQPAQQGSPKISLASLPVGGETDVDGARQCAHVGLIVHNQLPKGISVSIESIDLSQQGIFTLGGDLCAPDLTPCTTAWTWTTDTANKECAVAVTQVSDSEKPVSLVLVGTVHCPDQGACDEVQRSIDANGPNAHIEFTPSLGVVPGSSSSSSSSAAAAPSDSGSSPAGAPETSAATGASTSGS